MKKPPMPTHIFTVYCEPDRPGIKITRRAIHHASGALWRLDGLDACWEADRCREHADLRTVIAKAITAAEADARDAREAAADVRAHMTRVLDRNDLARDAHRLAHRLGGMAEEHDRSAFNSENQVATLNALLDVAG